MSKLSICDIELELNEKRQERRRLIRAVDDTDTAIGFLKLELDKRREDARRAEQMERDLQRIGK